MEEGFRQRDHHAEGRQFMDELREAVRDEQRTENLIAANYPNDAWRKAILWASASGQRGFLSHFLQRAPSDLKDLTQSALDANNFTALHRAVVAGQTQIVEILTSREHSESTQIFNVLHARTSEGWTALHLAVAAGDLNMVTVLKNSYDRITLPLETEWDFADHCWMTPLHYAVLGKLQAIVQLLLDWQTFERHLNANDYFMRTAAHLATSHKGAPIEVLVTNPKVELNAVDCCLYTPLHWAVFVGATEAIRCLNAQASRRRIRTLEEDIDGRPALQIAIESDWKDRKVGKDIEILLMTFDEVKNDGERLNRDRQVYVYATNALLVGAALISSVSFSGHLSPPGRDATVVLEIAPLRVFWACTGLSFFFAMATVLAGVWTVFPLPLEDVYIGEAVRKIRSGLVLTSVLLYTSVGYVLVGFASAGFENSLSQRHRTLVVFITAFGSALCIVILILFSVSLYRFVQDKRLRANVRKNMHNTIIQYNRETLVGFETEIDDAIRRAEEELSKILFDRQDDSPFPELISRRNSLTSLMLDLGTTLKMELRNRNPWVPTMTENSFKRRINDLEGVYRRARMTETVNGETQNPAWNMLVLNSLGPRGLLHWIEPFPVTFTSSVLIANQSFWTWIERLLAPSMFPVLHSFLRIYFFFVSFILSYIVSPYVPTPLYRDYCLSRDEEWWKSIRSQVRNLRPKLEQESRDFEARELEFENWVPLPRL